MENLLKPGTLSNRIAKVLSIVLAIGVLWYLVYCAHDAANTADSKKSQKKTFMPSSKSGNPTPFEPTPGKHPALNEPVSGKKTGTGKKSAPKKKRVFIHTSKSANFDVLPKKKKKTEEK